MLANRHSPANEYITEVGLPNLQNCGQQGFTLSKVPDSSSLSD